MRNKIFAFIGIMVFLAACKSGNEHEIPLFNEFKFHTDSTEKITEIDSLGQVPYIQHFNDIDDIQIPLYRIIKARDYTLYLGIPFHTNLQKIAAAKTVKPNADTVLLQSQSADNFYRKYKKGNLYLAEYMRNIDSVSIICVFGSSASEAIANDVLSEEKMSARIKK